MECQLLQIMEFGQQRQNSALVIGEVLLIHIGDNFYIDGDIQVPLLRVVGRLGGDYYCRTTNIFEMKRPPSGYD